MSDKKENIIQTALQLFAQQGYAGTSTARIAKAAGVSEGLIFRHFENKEGLLQAIMNLGKQEAEQLFGRVLMEADPRKRIELFLRMPFELAPEAYPFWKLLYSLKWQTSFYADQIGEPLLASLTDAFSGLGVNKPEVEAQCLLIWMDGIATQLLLHDHENREDLLFAILRRYGV